VVFHNIIFTVRRFKPHAQLSRWRTTLVGHPGFLIQHLRSYLSYLQAIYTIRNLRTRCATVNEDPLNLWMTLPFINNHLLPENLTVANLGKKFPVFEVTQSLVNFVHKNRPQVFILSHMNPNYTLPAYFFNIHMSSKFLAILTAS
jgi:poly(3-hydroxyalkanoate) synthetase